MIENFEKFHNNPIRGWKVPAEGGYGSLLYTELKEPGSNRPFYSSQRHIGHAAVHM